MATTIMKSTRTATPAREPDISEGENMSIDLKALREWIDKRRVDLLNKSFEAKTSGEFAYQMVGEMYALQAKAYEEVYDHITEMIKKDK
jgi:hypothetical protein